MKNACDPAHNRGLLSLVAVPTLLMVVHHFHKQDVNYATTTLRLLASVECTHCWVYGDLSARLRHSSIDGCF